MRAILRLLMIRTNRRGYGWLVAGGIATACLLPEMDTKLHGGEAGSAGSEPNAGSRGGSAGVSGEADAGGDGSVPQPSCAQGRVLCDTGCENLQTDPTNCGACGQVCAVGMTCNEARCTCASGLSSCDGRCVDLEGDVALDSVHHLMLRVL